MKNKTKTNTFPNHCRFSFSLYRFDYLTLELPRIKRSKLYHRNVQKREKSLYNTQAFIHIYFTKDIKYKSDQNFKEKLRIDRVDHSDLSFNIKFELNEP